MIFISKQSNSWVSEGCEDQFPPGMGSPSLLTSLSSPIPCQHHLNACCRTSRRCQWTSATLFHKGLKQRPVLQPFEHSWVNITFSISYCPFLSFLHTSISYQTCSHSVAPTCLVGEALTPLAECEAVCQSLLCLQPDVKSHLNPILSQLEEALLYCSLDRDIPQASTPRPRAAPARPPVLCPAACTTSHSAGQEGMHGPYQA